MDIDTAALGTVRSVHTWLEPHGEDVEDTGELVCEAALVAPRGAQQHLPMLWRAK